MGSKGRPASEADNLAAICEPTVYNSGSQSDRYRPLGAVRGTQ
jgi:hypothetical protein